MPANFEWPRCINYAEWHANGFDFLLRRCRPGGLMGPMRGWMNCDYWYVRRSRPWQPHELLLGQQLYRNLGDVLRKPGSTRLRSHG
jgi:hypothetical protein